MTPGLQPAGPGRQASSPPDRAVIATGCSTRSTCRARRSGAFQHIRSELTRLVDAQCGASLGRAAPRPGDPPGPDRNPPPPCGAVGCKARETLQTALTAVQESHDAGKNAWIMRRALDSVYASVSRPIN